MVRCLFSVGRLRYLPLLFFAAIVPHRLSYFVEKSVILLESEAQKTTWEVLIGAQLGGMKRIYVMSSRDFVRTILSQSSKPGGDHRDETI
ncbi:hypothetical protein RRG08_012873 [Elysia crispata]|uniref:Uncharacterized protein n=1 Tax=Elysia crispata TaxID=231223 RepID=A0AAE1AUT2_9GAST|nr:hypothetical protein RRG08_012873 [Elysia crispata]